MQKQDRFSKGSKLGYIKGVYMKKLKQEYAQRRFEIQEILTAILMLQTLFIALVIGAHSLFVCVGIWLLYRHFYNRKYQSKSFLITIIIASIASSYLIRFKGVDCFSIFCSLTIFVALIHFVFIKDGKRG